MNYKDLYSTDNAKDVAKEIMDSVFGEDGTQIAYIGIVNGEIELSGITNKRNAHCSKGFYGMPIDEGVWVSEQDVINFCNNIPYPLDPNNDADHAILMGTAEQFTGCANADGYKAAALKAGYKHCHVIDWTSSAGDWYFLISKDGETWTTMAQENAYPEPGFKYYFNDDNVTYLFEGTKDEALAYFSEL
jgi:hypothetical protein